MNDYVYYAVAGVLALILGFFIAKKKKKQEPLRKQYPDVYGEVVSYQDNSATVRVYRRSNSQLLMEEHIYGKDEEDMKSKSQDKLHKELKRNQKEVTK